MQAGVTFVLEIWVPKLLRVVANDTLHQRKVVKEDRSTQTPGWIDPSIISWWTCADLGLVAYMSKGRKHDEHA
jgi:hypothetical protein